MLYVRILNLFETFDIKKNMIKMIEKRSKTYKNKKMGHDTYKAHCLSYLRGKMVKSFMIIL